MCGLLTGCAPRRRGERMLNSTNGGLGTWQSPKTLNASEFDAYASFLCLFPLANRCTPSTYNLLSISFFLLTTNKNTHLPLRNAPYPSPAAANSIRQAVPTPQFHPPKHLEAPSSVHFYVVFRLLQYVNHCPPTTYIRNPIIARQHRLPSLTQRITQTSTLPLPGTRSAK